MNNFKMTSLKHTISPILTSMKYLPRYANEMCVHHAHLVPLINTYLDI